MLPTIAVVNRSSVPARDVAAAVKAVQYQVSHEFKVAWGVDAIVSVSAAAAKKPGAWPCFITDKPGPGDPADALGYHDVTPAGLPVLYLFAGLLDDPRGLASLMGHEVLETLADPWAEWASITMVGGVQSAVIAEVGDPVEEDAYPSPVNGLPLTNFVFPSWFRADGAGPWDQMGTLSGPLTKTAGGYWQHINLSGRWIAESPKGERKT